MSRFMMVTPQPRDNTMDKPVFDKKERKQLPPRKPTKSSKSSSRKSLRVVPSGRTCKRSHRGCWRKTSSKVVSSRTRRRSRYNRNRKQYRVKMQTPETTSAVPYCHKKKALSDTSPIISFDHVNVQMGDVTATDPGPRVQTEEPSDNNSAIFGKTCCNHCGPFDCIERRLRHLFAAWGRIVARHPWPLFLLPIFVTMGLCIGFFFITMETSQEKLYTPINGQAKSERKTVEDLFSSVSWEAHTTPARLTELGRYVQVIFTRDDDQTVLTPDLLEKASDVHQMVLNHVESSKADYEYEDLCVMWHGTCLANNVLTLYEDDPTYFTDSNITYPYTFLPDGNVGFLGSELGGVELLDKDEFEPEFSPVKSARAFRLLYYLKSDGEFDEINAEFESFVMRGVSEMSADWEDVSAVPFAARTADDEVKAATFESVVLFPIASTLLLIFTVGSCMMKDPVRSKPWLAIAAIVSTLLAMLSAPGLLCFFGVPFVDMAAAMPFIIIGRGLDDAFIMLAAWRQTDTNFSVERRMSLSLADAVMSITATTITDTLAFMIGGISDFLSVRTFCFYTGLAVVFDYIYQITFFAACMVFTGQREAEGRHCFTMKRVHKNGKEKQEKSKEIDVKTEKNAYVEGTPTASDGKIDHAFMTFFRDHFGPLIMNPFVKVVVMLVYFGYLGVAIWGCLWVEQGLTERNLVREGSDAHHFLDLKYEYFKTYEPAVSIVVETEQNYWEPEIQDVINRTLTELQDDEHFHDSGLTVSWLHEYTRFLELVGVSSLDISKDLFISILREQFLQIPAFEPFKLDIVFDETNTSIVSSRYFVMGKDLFPSEDEKAMMLKAREVAKDSEFPMITYSPAFVYFDQFVAVIPTTLQNMVLAIASIMFASFLLIPSVTCVIWVTIAVVSILVGVIGYMTFWDVNLHSMSLLTLILSVGFSVDYTIHITSSFVSARGTRRDRVIHALYSVGMPIVQGSLSTMFAIFLFAFSSHYAFRVFFKSLTLVITFGIAHGLVFLPVILSVLGPSHPNKRKVESETETPCNRHKSNELPS